MKFIIKKKPIQLQMGPILTQMAIDHLNITV